jgi:hypothetical protein
MMARIVPLPAVVLSLAVVVLASCKTDPSGVATNTDAGADGAGPAAFWSAGACGSCVLTSCSKERTLCDAEPSCVEHATCAEACPARADGSVDETCLARCPEAEGTAATRVRAAYDSCLVGRGPAACDACPKAAPPPSLSPIFEQKCASSDETIACHKCESEHCCETYQACADEPECKQAVQPCVVACKTDQQCVAKCYADHPKGVLPWAKRQACMMVHCVTDCGGSPGACEQCAISGQCRDSRARCATDEGCFLIQACIDATCPDVTEQCLRGCKEKVPEVSGRLFDDWIGCVLLSCGDFCK